MARPRSIPGYCHHKATDQAYASINGREVYLGRHGTRESKAAYDRLIAQWLITRNAPAASPGEPRSVCEVLAAFIDHAEAYYKGSAELGNFVGAIRPLKRLFGSTAAAEFGPLKLKSVRGFMVAGPDATPPGLGWSRTYANRQVARIKQVFKWATENELVPPTVHHGLLAVAGLRKGRAEAREAEPVRPVPVERVETTLPFLSPALRAMVRLQLLTGCRSGELCRMRSADIDTAGAVWVYRPGAHKTAHHGHGREIFIGPQARRVLKPWLKPELSAFIFSPAESEADRRQRKHAQRLKDGTPMSCGNVPGSNVVKRRRARRRPGDRYDTKSYARAIARACEFAFGMPAEIWITSADRPRAHDAPGSLKEKAERRKAKAAARRAWHAEHCWHPHQLRHTAGTAIRRTHGLEVARILLGHRTAAVTEMYAEADRQKAIEVMRKIG